MPPLPSDLRKTLENAIIAARRAAEEAARAALTSLGVAQVDKPAVLDSERNRLRLALRAVARQLGDDIREKEPKLPLLTHEVAYEQWHRMLFARFLAENDLLMHPSGVAVSLADCAELAPEDDAEDAWDLAARYAGAMLPGIFLAGDPTVQVRFAPEGRQKLEAILAGLPPAVFTADDGLGWVYQFWQIDKKKEVNASGRKIGGADLAPVTQLFTEDYMVRFLLENSLGAWWAARHPGSPLVKTFTYLRYRDDGAPAAGAFPGWPDRAALITCMDPCGGSGHFVVAEFEMLRRMRMEEEGLAEAEAGDAVIRDNLFMLELDQRCTQIATFALALAAWKSGGYRPLPTPNIACSGIAVTGQLDDWLRLAGDNEKLRTALERLWRLFRDAPTLGSLINPADVPLAERMFTADYEEVAPLLEKALARERDDPAAAVLGVAAEGVAKAAELLAGQYTLVATNVPYIGFKKQTETLKRFCEQHYPDGKMDLATVFVERCRGYAVAGGCYSLVTPQNWLSLGSYMNLRQRMLREQCWHSVNWLGPRAFETITGEIVQPALLLFSKDIAPSGQAIFGMDVSFGKTPTEKADLLRSANLEVVPQAAQLQNPDARILLRTQTQAKLLRDYVWSPRGVVTGDGARWIRCFWEINLPSAGWRFLQSTVQTAQQFGGREHIINWSFGGEGMLRPGLENPAYGRHGVAVSQMGDLPCVLYTGELYDNNTGAVVPKDPAHLAAIWMFCQSPDYHKAVRQVDKSLAVTNDSLVKIPFDLPHWQRLADAAGPLPEPYSNDPTQWPFAGHPAGATVPLQVAVARLLGYRWPQQADDNLTVHADADGIVCLPAVGGEASAAERLRALLRTAHGDGWSAVVQEQLLAAAGFTGKTLDDWLADGFFPQHCRVFHNRPFIWHIWDGRKDGFAALVNYHKLDRARLEKLIYTYLGAWIKRQRDERDAGVPAADGRLVDALALQKKLIAILEGEPPYDNYVRWKPLDEQPIGWAPDLNDGVRLNIRPFVTAGVLRSKFTINWNKDRGTNPDGSERMNDPHKTRAEKLAARAKAGQA